ncbi:lactate dehydrogenase-like oxidoreductase [Rivularia sp. PCC 7116]|uniref:2-hydroxyacid dehydrogenase n=1 Tax=Rivularia sp. PCC 7116 TaxID=373994 RepID=UPI00029ECBE2|nr:2-hydroxyacid dehydrogenase [Rivularia sp. PCC 7116]AFY54554.1 lactate dehydrogenase-like oxidoreductase [Rivularia sp. PCC 7116]
MKVAVFSSKKYDRSFLSEANSDYGHELVFFEPKLSSETTALAAGFPAVCAFINDQIDRHTISAIAEQGTKLIALRSAGFNNVDIKAATDLGITVVRVPAYSPYAVAEHAAGLILTLNRKYHRAHNRVRESNFSLNGLLGFDLHHSTVGIIGTGKIGMCFARIMKGFGCNVLAYDIYQNPECLEMGVQYVELSKLLATSDIVSLHCPLTPDSYHMINAETLEQFKSGAMLINTSRGGLIDTKAVIDALKSQKLGYVGLDVYEQEGNLFFEDLSQEVIQDDIFQRLLTFPNVVITAHQAFFTKNALENIAQTTINNISDFEKNGKCDNTVNS